MNPITLNDNKITQPAPKLNQLLEKERKDIIIIQSVFRSYLAQLLLLHEKYLNNVAKIREQVPVDCYKSIFMRLDFKSALSVACVDKKRTDLVKHCFKYFLETKYPHSPLTNLNPINAYYTHVNQQCGQITETTLPQPRGVHLLAYSKTDPHLLMIGFGSDTISFTRKGVTIDKLTVKGIEIKDNHATFSSDDTIVFFSDGNRCFLYKRDDKTIKWWNAHAAFLSNHGAFLVRYGTNCVSIIDTRSLKVVNELYSKESISTSAFSPNDKIWAIAFKNELYASREKKDDDSDVDDTDENGFYLNLTNHVASDLGICLWNLDSNEFNLILQGQAARISNLTFSPDGKILAVVSDDSKLRLLQWESIIKREEETGPSQTDSYVSEFKIPGNFEYKVTFSPDGNYLALIYQVCKGSRNPFKKKSKSGIFFYK